jgi:hypothetical protein
MRRRLFVSLAVAALVSGVAFPAAAMAKDPTAQRFSRVAIGKVDPKLLPALIDPARWWMSLSSGRDQPIASRIGDADDRTQSPAAGHSLPDQTSAAGCDAVAIGRPGHLPMQDAYNGVAHVRSAELSALALCRASASTWCGLQ